MIKPSITLYLHVHQPWRIRRYDVFDIANSHDYFAGDGPQDNAAIFRKIADTSYRPMNALLKELLRRYPEFHISLSMSGLYIEQAEQFAPDVLADFQALVGTGRVEILASPYHHSLAFFYSLEEFERQLAQHERMIQRQFDVQPRVLANTELAYNDELAAWAEAHGYRGVVAEGWDAVLGWRSPNYIYRPKGTTQLGLLLKNYRLSDDIAFRFSDQDWKHWPLTAATFDDWVRDSGGDVVNLCMDYETFGEHQWRDHGVFEFFSNFVERWLGAGGQFHTVSQALEHYQPTGELSMPRTITWADSERDLSAWNGNDIQKQALLHLYALESAVLKSGDQSLIDDWRRLQTSDHFYYMCTKWAADGDVHAYFRPYESPFDAALYFMNAVRDIGWRLNHLPSRHN